MNWKKISVKTTEENADIAASVLMDAGVGGVEMQGGGVPEVASDGIRCGTGRMPYRFRYFRRGRADALANLHACMPQGYVSETPELSVETVPDTDWNEFPLELQGVPSGGAVCHQAFMGRISG